jgi:pyrimidine-nucleoside phosphorylase
MKQHRHPMSTDLINLSNILSGWMLHLAGRAETPEAGAKLSNKILRSGKAYKAWLKIIEAQGGDITVFKDPAAVHKPAATRIFKAPSSGYLASMDCKQVGWAVQRLGAGRAKPGDPVSASAGIEMHAKLGDKIKKGQPLVTLFSQDATLLDEPEDMLRETITITPAPPKLQPLIREIITKTSLRP